MNKRDTLPDEDILRDLSALIGSDNHDTAPTGNIETAAAGMQISKALTGHIQQLRETLTPILCEIQEQKKVVDSLATRLTSLEAERKRIPNANKIDGLETKERDGLYNKATHSHQGYYFEWISADGNVQNTSLSVRSCSLGKGSAEQDLKERKAKIIAAIQSCESLLHNYEQQLSQCGFLAISEPIRLGKLINKTKADISRRKKALRLINAAKKIRYEKIFIAPNSHQCITGPGFRYEYLGPNREKHFTDFTSEEEDSSCLNRRAEVDINAAYRECMSNIAATKVQLENAQHKLAQVKKTAKASMDEINQHIRAAKKELGELIQ